MIRVCMWRAPATKNQIHQVDEKEVQEILATGLDLSKASALHTTGVKTWVDNKVHFVGVGKK